ncbi:hypothetical protein GCM10009789_30460 [Kribbella sancticallisti]|uniref:Cellobiose transport system permease protein n=1 Tax=Kribbella sancticallisti TaxID=460087 RepID=A0ABP4P732_9ACTN
MGAIRDGRQRDDSQDDRGDHQGAGPSFTFINVWNDHLWPLIVMTDPNKLTLQVALQQLNGGYGTDYSMVMAGALMSVIPLIGVFIIGGRHFIADIAAGAMKF